MAVIHPGQIPAGFQDGTGSAALEKAWPRQRRTRQLSANLEPLDGLEDTGEVGVKQTTASSAWIKRH